MCVPGARHDINRVHCADVTGLGELSAPIRRPTPSVTVEIRELSEWPAETEQRPIVTKNSFEQDYVTAEVLALAYLDEVPD